MTIQKVIEVSFQDKNNRDQEHHLIVEEGNQKSVNSYIIQKIHTLEDLVGKKFEGEQTEIKLIKEAHTESESKLEKLIKQNKVDSLKQFKELTAMIQDIKNEVNNWSTSTIFYRMLVELRMHKRVSVDPRFVDRLKKQKMSDLCIFCVSRMPDGKIILDANNRGTIIDHETFEVVHELDPKDSQLTSIAFAKEKMVAHYQSMYNISYLPSGKYY